MPERIGEPPEQPSVLHSDRLVCSAHGHGVGDQRLGVINDEQQAPGRSLDCVWAETVHACDPFDTQNRTPADRQLSHNGVISRTEDSMLDDRTERPLIERDGSRPVAGPLLRLDFHSRLGDRGSIRSLAFSAANRGRATTLACVADSGTRTAGEMPGGDEPREAGVRIPTSQRWPTEHRGTRRDVGTESNARGRVHDARPGVAGGSRAGGGRAARNLSDDGNGKRWRQLTQTTGLTPDQVAQVCPRDGETRCAGSVGSRDLTGWVWATGAQVQALMGLYEPAIVTADPPVVGGPEYLGSAMGLLEDMAPTLSVTGYNFHHSFTGGWTSSTEADGRATFASAGFGWYPIGGSFGVGPATNPDPIQYYGVWLWRPAGDDITAPTITPTVSGTIGKNGWHVSDVTVTWDVRDAESEASTAGCDATTCHLRHGRDDLHVRGDLRRRHRDEVGGRQT